MDYFPNYKRNARTKAVDMNSANKFHIPNMQYEMKLFMNAEIDNWIGRR